MKQREGFWQWYLRGIKEFQKNKFLIGLLETTFISGSGIYLIVTSTFYFIETILEKEFSFFLLLMWLAAIPVGITIFAYGIYRFKRRITNDE